MRLPRALRNPGARALRHIPLRIQALRSLVNHGDRVWDIGAHKGYVSMVLSRSVGEEGGVTSFEPSQENLWFLLKHIFISIHSRTAYDECRGLLMARRYRLHDSVEMAKRLADPASHWGAEEKDPMRNWAAG